MLLCSLRPHTPLLHGFKNNPVYTAMRAEAMSKGKFVPWSQNPVYVELVEKLWRITGLEKINPIRGGKKDQKKDKPVRAGCAGGAIKPG